jgi:hypothetical protein
MVDRKTGLTVGHWQLVNITQSTIDIQRLNVDSRHRKQGRLSATDIRGQNTVRDRQLSLKTLSLIDNYARSVDGRRRKPG